MIVFAAKVSLKKAAAGVLAVGFAVLCAVTLMPRAEETAADAQAGMDSRLKTNEDRVALLESYGWQVEPEPKEFDEAYEEYNAIQLAQGLDLSVCRGKRATLYTYDLTEYPTGETGVTANLLIRRSRLIAADISSAETDGFVHGLTGPDDT